jgi:hypothetical protein
LRRWLLSSPPAAEKRKKPNRPSRKRSRSRSTRARAIYDTDAPVDKVAEFYAQAYGYNTIAPDATNNLSSAKPPAYYRTGDLAKDLAPIVTTAKKLNPNLDATKAVGTYRAVEIDPKPNRPRVTIQRPYFDASSSQTVDRTLILMSR